jgi:hypothetical protein
MSSPTDREPRVAGLEADRAVYAAVLSAFDDCRRETSEGLDLLLRALGEIRQELLDLHRENRARFRSIHTQLAEIGDLIVQRRSGPSQ